MVGVPKQPQFLLSAYFCLRYLQIAKFTLMMLALLFQVPKNSYIIATTLKI